MEGAGGRGFPSLWALLTSFPYWRAAAIRSGPTCARGALTTVRGSTGPGVFALGAAVSQPSALGAVGAFALGAAGAFALGPVGGGSSAPSSAATTRSPSRAATSSEACRRAASAALHSAPLAPLTVTPMATPPTWTTRHGTTPDIRDTLQSGKLTGFDPYSTVTVREVVVSAVPQDMPLLHLR